jgi:hypothetical protein
MMVLFPGGWRWVPTLLVLLLGIGQAAAETEVRDFKVMVDDKDAGAYHMTLTEKDGVVTMTGAARVKVSYVVVSYKYDYAGTETWKDGRLQAFRSSCNDDGKKHEVSAYIDGKDLRVKADGKDSKTSVDTWLTSYWHLPDATLRKGGLSLMDADTGKLMTGKLGYIGKETMTVGGKEQVCFHYRLTGDVSVELWYDGSDRLVRQEWKEDGHKTVLLLDRVGK